MTAAQLSLTLTGSQQHELAKLAQSDWGIEIVEGPSAWDDSGSIVVTYKVDHGPHKWASYVELVIEPDGTRHVVR